LVLWSNRNMLLRGHCGLPTLDPPGGVVCPRSAGVLSTVEWRFSTRCPPVVHGLYTEQAFYCSSVAASRRPAAKPGYSPHEYIEQIRPPRVPKSGVLCLSHSSHEYSEQIRSRKPLRMSHVVAPRVRRPWAKSVRRPRPSGDGAGRQRFARAAGATRRWGCHHLPTTLRSWRDFTRCRSSLRRPAPAARF
jgi:hypothetical protein